MVEKNTLPLPLLSIYWKIEGVFFARQVIWEKAPENLTSLPTNLLMRVLFPLFGIPRIATFNTFPFLLDLLSFTLIKIFFKNWKSIKHWYHILIATIWRMLCLSVENVDIFWIVCLVLKICFGQEECLNTKQAQLITMHS